MKRHWKRVFVWILIDAALLFGCFYVLNRQYIGVVTNHEEQRIQVYAKQQTYDRNQHVVAARDQQYVMGKIIAIPKDKIHYANHQLTINHKQTYALTERTEKQLYPLLQGKQQLQGYLIQYHWQHHVYYMYALPSEMRGKIVLSLPKFIFK